MSNLKSFFISFYNRNIVLIYFSFATILISCDSDFPGDCFMNTGELVWEERELEAFKLIRLYDNVDLFIYPDSIDFIELYAGSNLIDKIITDVNDSILDIRNNNDCNWLRDVDKPIEVHLHTKSLKEIRYRGIGDIETKSAIQGPSFRLYIKEGHGLINIETNTHHAHLDYKSGTADVKYSGTDVDYLGVFTGAYGKFDSRKMHVRYVYINQMSNNDLYTNVRELLNAEIHMSGNVYYKGEPDSIIQVTHGTGKLIPIN